jgi:hypothetical protein
VGWVHGSKLTFFEAAREDYLAAAEISKTGSFYEKTCHQYLAKYGYNTPWKSDLEEGQDTADDVDPDEDVDDLTAEESKKRAAYFKLLKGVGSLPCSLPDN